MAKYKKRVEWGVRLQHYNLKESDDLHPRVVLRGTLDVHDLALILEERSRGIYRAADTELIVNQLMSVARDALVDGYALNTPMGRLTPVVRGMWNFNRINPAARAQNQASLSYALSTELKKAFEISGISKAPAIFDDQKLRAINGAYVHKMDPADFEKAAEPYIRQTVKRTDIDLSLLCSVLQNRTEVFSDIPEQVDFIDAMPEYDLEMYRHKKMKTTPETALEALKEVLPVLESVEQWDTEHIHEALFAKIADLGVKNGWMLWPLRTAVSGKQFTPGGGVELCAILGKEDTLARVRKAIDALSA